jgi:hypothetical protein
VFQVLEKREEGEPRRHRRVFVLLTRDKIREKRRKNSFRLSNTSNSTLALSALYFLQYFPALI